MLEVWNLTMRIYAGGNLGFREGGLSLHGDRINTQVYLTQLSP